MIFDIITHVLKIWHAIGMPGIFVKLFGENGSKYLRMFRDVRLK